MSSKIEKAARTLARKRNITLSDIRAFKEAVRTCDKGQKGEALSLIRSAAKERYESAGALEIDPDAIVSISEDDGAYVQAWVWVQ